MDAGFKVMEEVKAVQGGMFHGDYELGLGLGVRQGSSLVRHLADYVTLCKWLHLCEDFFLICHMEITVPPP